MSNLGGFCTWVYFSRGCSLRSSSARGSWLVARGSWLVGVGVGVGMDVAAPVRRGFFGAVRIRELQFPDRQSG